MRARLGQLRSFIRWTAPLYALFLGAGLIATQFAFRSDLAILAGILVGFAVLDAAMLSRIRHIEAAEIRTAVDLRTTRAQIERLSRWILGAGAGLGAAFLGLFIWLALRG